MSPRSWSSRPTKSHVATGRPKRLQVEPLEGREVPATFTVTTFADIVDPADGRLSLREAISRANTNPGADTILLKAGTYAQSLTEGDDTNTLGDFDVTDSLTIAGVGPAATVIKGSRNDRLFEAFGPIDLRFNNLTLRDAGHVFIDGGAIQATFANISLNNCVAANNNSNRGGVINAENGAVTVRNSRLFNNLGHFEGGAISVGQGSLFLDRSTVSGNLANSGGGIFSEAAAVTISRSTVALNTALFTGGGIDSEHVQVTLSNTSVRGNLADLDGGGVAAGGGIVLTNCSVTGNRSTSERGGGIAASAATARGSTFSGNSCQEFGGGIKATVINLTNCTVSGNTALEGGGISAGDLATLTNCTVSG
ncbi:MAG TPA: CSLREA domain-containing protein, partial [Gemmataceae bacterium]|nr:CSLREA domain-containing protein [Gemmataceae bacterium]